MTFTTSRSRAPSHGIFSCISGQDALLFLSTHLAVTHPECVKLRATLTNLSISQCEVMPLCRCSCCLGMPCRQFHYFIENFLPSIKKDREPEVFQMDNAFYRGGSLQNNTSIYSPCSERKMHFIEGNRGNFYLQHVLGAYLGLYG